MNARFPLFGISLPKTFHFKLLSIAATVLLAVTAVVISVHSSSSPLASAAGTTAKSGENSRAPGNILKTSSTAAVRRWTGPAPLAPLAPTVTASKTDSLFTDVDSDLQADPGDTLKYTVTIDSIGEDATGLTFTDTVDPNTAFVPGSLTATPVAVDDSYAATGNIRISVAAPGVLGNDFNGVPGATITAPPTTSLNGGNVSLAADGSFTYNPPAGFEGVDTFSYTLTNAAGSNNATVSITVSGMIWFIDNNAATCTTLAAGCGRLTNPFSSLSAFAALNNGTGNNPAANDNIFVYESATDYVGPVTLLNGQRFIGQDATASLSAITGITPAPGSDPLPATNSSNATIANITSASTAITVGLGNTLVGFTGGDAVTDISGTGFGTLTISDVTLNGNGQALSLTTGTLAATFGGISSANSSTTGVSLSGVAGTLTSPATTVTNAAGIGISVDTSNATLNFGNTSSTLSGDTGVSLLTNTGAITFGSLDIAPDANQRGLLATENSNTITATSGAIATSGAVAVQITRSVGTTPLVVSLTSVAANGGTDGIVLTNTNGSFTVTGDAGIANNSSGGTIQNLTNIGINLSNTQNISLDQMNIQSITRSGINGTQVTNFSFTNGTINNSGTTGFESNIAFNTSPNTASNITGTLTVTGNTLTNAFYSGLDIQSGDGTISNADISNNVITSTTSTATSQGFGINIRGVGTATTAFALNNATISNNAITNFPTASGIQVNGGNANPTGPGGTIGIPDDPSNLVAITSNTIQGQNSANRMGASAIIVAVIGGNNTSAATRSRANINISNNPTLTNIAGTVIGVGCNGHTTMTATVDNNVVVANHQPNLGGANGIGGGAGTGGATTNWFPALTLSVTNNNVSQTDGNGILLVNRATRGSMDLKLTGNTVGAPINAGGAVRQGIRVDSGNSAADDTFVCATISGNTSAGSNGASGIGIRKQGNVATTDDFGITGLSPTPATGAQAAAFVATQNPAGGGCDVISGNNYVSCGSAPLSLVASGGEGAMRKAGKGESAAAGSSPAETEDILQTTQGDGPGGNDVHRLTQSELMALLPAAIERWRVAGISAADLIRLQAVAFEITDLPAGQLATATSTSVKIDETAAGFGWYSDVSPLEDSEFEVAVPDRELQTTEFSSAFGRMDLLTVVMRELGVAYRRGLETRLPKQLRPLMETTLSPAVRRLPDSRTIKLTSATGRVSGKARSSGQASIASRSGKAAALKPQTAVSASRASSRNAQFNPIAQTASQRSGKLLHHAPRNSTTAMVSSMVADVMLNIGTLPAGESVTITFNVTVDDPFGGALPQVSNQGTVSGSNFADVLTDDPTVGGTADPTVTPIDLPQVSLAVSPASVLEDGATNLVYTFTRTGSTANAMTVNFSVGGSASFTEPDYTQTGAATFTATNGTVVIPGGSSTATVTIDPSADTTVEPDETVDLTVTSGTGYTVGAPSAASGTITNDDADVSVAVSPASVAEDGATNLVYTFTRAGATTNSLTVNFSVGGTASFGVSPDDYTQTGATTFTPPTGTVTFTAGSSTATVTVDPESDTTIEADQTVILTLTAGAGYNVSSPSSATGTITNDDADVSVAVAPAAVAEDGATNLVYTFTRTGFTSGALTVNFSVGGTATFGPSPDDYTQTGATTYTTTSGSVTFGAGNATATVTVNPETDTTAESDETVIIALTAGASYNVVSPSSATGTILNDDTLVSVAVAPSSTAEGGANLVYTFTRTGPTTSVLSVNFSVGGSASFPADYSQSGAATFTPPTATVTFGVGNSTATVTVTPLTDCTVEGPETVVFTVQPGTGYGVGSPGTATGTITNTPDSTLPTITCNADVVADFDPAVGGAVVTYTAPVGSDNCPGATTAQIAGLPSGSTFPLGTTTNTFRVTDASGNTAECSFKVTVALTSIIGLDSVTISGASFIDSYNSAIGYPASKSSQANVLSNGTITMGNSGKVWGNVRSTQAGINMTGASQVTGNATAGTTVSLSGSASVGGTITNGAPAPAITLPAVPACGPPYSPNSGISGTYSYNPGTGDLSLSGANIATLANGNYCFHNITMGNSAQLKVNGLVNIKMTGTLNLSGNSSFTNTTGIPGNLRVLSSLASGGNGVILGNGTNVTMVIYAPQTGASISGSAPLFGTVAAKRITLGNSGAIHYDTELKNVWPDLWALIVGP